MPNLRVCLCDDDDNHAPALLMAAWRPHSSHGERMVQTHVLNADMEARDSVSDLWTVLANHPHLSRPGNRVVQHPAREPFEVGFIIDLLPHEDAGGATGYGLQFLAELLWKLRTGWHLNDVREVFDYATFVIHSSLKNLERDYHEFRDTVKGWLPPGANEGEKELTRAFLEFLYYGGTDRRFLGEIARRCMERRTGLIPVFPKRDTHDVLCAYLNHVVK